MRQMTRRTIKLRKRAAGRTIFGRTRGWIAAGTLAAYAVMAGTKSAQAEKEKGDPPGSSAAEATLPLKKFDIAPGPLDGAVEAYEKATGLTVKIMLPAGTLRRIQLAGSCRTLSRRRGPPPASGRNGLELSRGGCHDDGRRGAVEGHRFCNRFGYGFSFADEVYRAPADYRAEHHGNTAVCRKGRRSNNAAGHAAQCARYQPGRRRSGSAGRQPDDSRIYRPERYLPRRHPRLRQLLPRHLQLRAGRSARRTGRHSVWTRVNRWSREPGKQGPDPTAVRSRARQCSAQTRHEESQRTSTATS